MTKATLLHVAERVIKRPLLILPDKLAIITEVLSGRIGLEGALAEDGFRTLDPEAAAAADKLLREGPEASRFEGDAYETDDSGKAVGMLPYRRTKDGVAVISITGSLIHRGAWVGMNSGKTSYEGIAHQLTQAARDPKAKCILLDIASPGGEAVGAFETADLVRKIGAEKPVHAIVNGMAASAAYAIASGAKTITAIPSGLAGSIGVVMLHADYSRAADRAGITPTLIFSGAHKVDANPYQPLSGAVRDDLQAECDKFYSQFLQTVAAGRGKRCNASMARKTEARTFMGVDGIEAGLVDQIGSFAELVDALAKSGAKRGRPMMPMKEKMSMTSKIYSEEDVTAAEASARKAGDGEGFARGHIEGEAKGREAGRAEGLEEGRKAGMAEGASAERARIKSILDSDAAKGRASSALHLALNTSLSVDEATAALTGLALDAPKSGAGSSIGARAGEAIVEAPAGKAAASVWDAAVAKVNERVQ